MQSTKSPLLISLIKKYQALNPQEKLDKTNCISNIIIGYKQSFKPNAIESLSLDREYYTVREEIKDLTKYIAEHPDKTSLVNHYKERINSLKNRAIYLLNAIESYKLAQ